MIYWFGLPSSIVVELPLYFPAAALSIAGIFLSYDRSNSEAFANEIRKRLNQDLPSRPVWQACPEIEAGLGCWRQIETGQGGWSDW